MPYAPLLLISAINLLTIILTNNLSSSANLPLITKSALSVIRTPAYTAVRLIIITVVVVITVLIRAIVIIKVVVILLPKSLLLIKEIIL